MCFGINMKKTFQTSSFAASLAICELTSCNAFKSLNSTWQQISPQVSKGSLSIFVPSVFSGLGCALDLSIYNETFKRAWM